MTKSQNIKIQSKPKTSLVNKLLKSCPVNVLEKLLKSTFKNKMKGNKIISSSNSKDIKSPVQNNWIPTVGSSFDEVMIFVLSSIFNNCDTFHKEYYQNCLNQVRSTYLFLIQHHGVSGGTRKWKEQTQYIVLLAENRNPEPLPWVATIKGPYPLPEKFSSLLKLISHIREEGQDWIKAYQAMVTILSFARLSREVPELNLETIINPRTSDEKGFQDFLKGFRTFCKESPYLKTDTPEVLWVTPRARMTKGPNKESTLTSAFSEAKRLIQDKVLGKSFELFATHTGNRDFYNYVENLSNLNLKDVSDIHLGQLALVPDSLNKHRLVAMVDYWTNLILAPLEELIRDLLKRRFRENDFLRDHNLGSQKVRDFKGPSWSIDLSSWTDRFPIDLQQIVVECLLGKNCGQHWATLLNGREFYVPELKKGVRYKVGQPMGSKSSFAVASLTHHMLILYCAHSVHTDAKKIKDNLYAIVGDDLVVFSEPLVKEVRKAYKILGVEIQDSKSKFPVGQNHFTEFCSRISINNVDASRIPPNVIRNASHNWRDFPVLLIEMKKRGIEPLVSLLKELPSLKKVSKSGKSYLSELQTVLRFPIMGQDLSRLASEIGELVPLPTSEDAIVSSVIYMQVMQAIEKVDDANTCLMENFRMEEPHYDILLDITFGDQVPQWHVWNPNGAIFRLAMGDNFKIKDWNLPIPHPASLASAWMVFNSYKTNMKGMGSFQTDSPDQVQAVMLWLKDIGKLVGAILPKEADSLIPTAGNMGTEFVRNQISLYARIFNASVSQKPIRFTKWDIEFDPTKWAKETSFKSLIVSEGTLPMHAKLAFEYLVCALPELPTWEPSSEHEVTIPPVTPPPTS